jgi:YD repeat-containing protein
MLIKESDSRSALIRAEGYVYDGRGRSILAVDEEGRITKYFYDGQSRLSAVLYPWAEEKAEADRKSITVAKERQLIFHKGHWKMRHGEFKRKLLIY